MIEKISHVCMNCEPPAVQVTAYKVMAYIVMAYTVMAYTVMAYTVMAYEPRAACGAGYYLYSYGPHSNGLYSYGL